MAERDYYQVLGVSRESSDEEIRKAYKKLARQYHPDVRPDDKEAAKKFKEIQEAYSVVGDSEKRKQYDRYGAAFQEGGGAPRGRSYSWSSGAGGGEPIDISELFGGQFDFGDLFGGNAARGAGGPQPGPRPRRGQDVHMEIQVPFEVAAQGGNQALQLRYDGKTERLNVKIPAGVETGSVIRLAGQGEPGMAGGPAGDLLLTIDVAPHAYFRREGNNLLLDVPVTPAEAALGAKVEVPTLSEGRVTVTVPPGTSSGTKLRLRGKGVAAKSGGSRGDQFVVVKIVVPRQLDEEAHRLYVQLAEASPQTPRAGLW